MLDGNVVCSLWTPYNKRHIKGKLYLSNNYICFMSKVINLTIQKYKQKRVKIYFLKVPKIVEVIIPIRNIYLVEKPSPSSSSDEHDLQNTLIITTKNKVN